MTPSAAASACRAAEALFGVPLLRPPRRSPGFDPPPAMVSDYSITTSATEGLFSYCTASIFQHRLPFSNSRSCVVSLLNWMPVVNVPAGLCDNGAPCGVQDDATAGAVDGIDAPSMRHRATLTYRHMRIEFAATSTKEPACLATLI
jgi:hypothetical protein